jgi:hypothetical protein
MKYWRITLDDLPEWSWEEMFTAERSFENILEYLQGLDYKVLTWQGDENGRHAERIAYPGRAVIMEVTEITEEEYHADRGGQAEGG